MSLGNVASQHIQELLEAFSNKRVVFNGEQEKKFHYLCVDEIEKSVPHQVMLNLLGRIFLFYPQTHDIFLL